MVVARDINDVDINKPVHTAIPVLPLQNDDVIVIDGAYDGEIVCNHLIVGPTGTVKGKITASSAEISGHVSAEITTKQLMAVRSTGRVEGSWDCGAIEVARGAVLNGAANVAESTPAQRAEAPLRLRPGATR